MTSANNNFRNVTIAHMFYGVLIRLIDFFGIVFVYRLLDSSLVESLLVFAGIHIGYAILAFFFTNLIGKFGTTRSAISALILILISFCSLYLIEKTGDLRLIYLFMLTFAFGRFMYLIPTHINTVKAMKSEHQGE